MKRYLAYLPVALLLAAAVWRMQCAGESDPKIPATLQRNLDSLSITQPTHEARQDSLEKLRVQDSLSRVDAQKRAATAERSARESRRIADSLKAVAQSAMEWKAAHDEREQEARRWELASIEKESALQQETRAHARTRMALLEEQTRRKGIEYVTVPALTTAIAKLDPPCRVLGFAPCPSRTLSGIVGAGLGLAGGWALGRGR